ncbi:unnamed protein product [Adineta ricciae]|uniref:Phosphatidylinositol-glycan biosynthesis class W protein n=1 Tax=Adineta ricciae TaxID=249248 RepID=A0A814C7D5_ADIRI|nr:unnamed protein product [Adineta ricciae]CAF1121023.1 unnamed protein product [Adineta ricciae]
MDDYRQRKESFVSNLNGTTLYETGAMMINICTTYFLYQILQSSFSKSRTWNYFSEYIIVVIPLIFATTALSSFNHLLHFILCGISLLIYLIRNPSSSSERQSSHPNSSYSRILEVFRGQMFIVTCICILAVDFPIFPRRYAKTENYGYSTMDLGVGLFAMAHGMVSSEARDKQTKIKDLFLENFILLLLGVIRLLSIKYFSYVEHVSEYGVHWNFFLTLCFMKLFASCLLFITKNVPLSIAVSLVFHQMFLLHYLQFDTYLINSNQTRIGFIEANREGIFSLSGYVCLYLIGVYMGKYVIRNEREQCFKNIIFKFTIASVILCAISYNSSRKLCNFGYITSTTGLACMTLAGFGVTQWLLVRKGYSTESALLKSVNQKGLDVFLLGNVLTGMINLNINTIDTPDFLALSILIIYTIIITSSAYFLPSIIKLLMKYVNLSKH